ncbi:MAG TPA: LamG domain-containing protein [Puia sp.]|jgi:hypothetical protein
MKTSLLIVTCLLLVFCTTFSCKKSQPEPPKPTDSVHLNTGLLLYLPFNGNFADSSGNGNQYTAIGGAALTYDEHGYANSAFGGTGAGERLLVTNNGSIKFDTAFSLSFDVMVNDLRNQVFFSLVQSSNAHGFTFDCGLNVPGDEQYEVGVGDITRSCDDIGDKNPNNVEDSTGFHLVPGSWYNIISIYHRGAVTTYVNGRLVSSKQGTGTKALNCPDAQFIVGSWWAGGPESINGKLDEVRFYNRTLNKEEIATLAQHFQLTSTSIRQVGSR